MYKHWTRFCLQCRICCFGICQG